MADRQHIALADEEMRLAEGDAAVLHLRGARDDEQTVPILLELGILMRLAGVLDRQRMQIELPLHAREQLERGLVEPDPHDMAGTRGEGAGCVDLDILEPLAAGIDGGGDHAGLAGRLCAYRSCRSSRHEARADEAEQ